VKQHEKLVESAESRPNYREINFSTWGVDKNLMRRKGPVRRSGPATG